MIKDFVAVMRYNKSYFFGLMCLFVAGGVFMLLRGISISTSTFLLAYSSLYGTYASLFSFQIPPKFNPGRAPFKGSFPFMIKYMVLDLLAQLVVLAVLILLSPDVLSSPLLMVAAAAGLCIVRPPLLATVGTWLPAGLAGYRASLKQSTKRGLATFWRVYFHILASTIAQFFFVILISTVAVFVLPGVGKEGMYGSSDFASLVVNALNLVVVYLAALYVAVVLGRTYLAAEGLKSLADVPTAANALSPIPRAA